MKQQRVRRDGSARSSVSCSVECWYTTRTKLHMHGHTYVPSVSMEFHWSLPFLYIKETTIVFNGSSNWQATRTNKDRQQEQPEQERAAHHHTRQRVNLHAPGHGKRCWKPPTSWSARASGRGRLRPCLLREPSTAGGKMNLVSCVIKWLTSCLLVQSICTKKIWCCVM